MAGSGPKTIAASVLALFASCVIALAAQGPRIQATELTFDLGKVKAGERPEHVFVIKNSGDEVLVIGKVQPS